MTILKIGLWIIGGLLLAILLARALFALPDPENRIDSRALPADESTALAGAVSRLHAAHPGQTGIAPLGTGAEAFAARMILADAAETSIDAQYYIWHHDLTGMLLLDALRRAAERGVRVRLLVDDNGTSGLDPELASLNAHPNVEVRIYNPFNLRRFKMLSYGFDFFRLNRRMHNKSFTVDGAATILGGRNIGDEYFDTGPTALYVDLDVLAVGEVVPEVAADFDRYWAAPSVYPAGPIVGPVPSGDPIGDRLQRLRRDPQAEEYREIVEQSQIVAELATGTFDLEWTGAVLVSDDPAKGQGAVPRNDLLAARLTEAVGEIEERFDGISPYFVPGAAGTEAFAELEARGVQVRILTNALEATDVFPVHAGYAKRRRDLLQAGVGIFELRRRATIRTPRGDAGPFGSSGSSLHAKTFAVDGARIFVGSFNFDPRSTSLNTEMGLLIDSPSMAMRMHDAFDDGFEGVAWRVSLQDGDLTWTSGEEVTHREPGSNMLKSVGLTVIGWLPVEWLL
ncbi:phospholipase D family protein [Marivita sp. GX14005]|uniref:phospholipase D family protein n=1 Tax=Marivita sp. GX14005 TaxID=2942276 RepID=UPI0020198D07|nr:phospholipase D family protein [Marivita sp. GX14005]MCL3882913.1 phospholipase D family protein [Marivita sp. GX14005]